MASAHWTRRAAAALLASTVLASPAAASAQDTGAGEPAGTEAKTQVESDSQDIIVTAQRRAENLQDVPIAITAITTKTLDDLKIDDLRDYARLVPSLSYKSGGGGGSADGPGTNNVYFRGVASGENANHSASLPSVGTYLDEQPITTIGGALDIHVFDIARVEALAGPQGTLYGASSQAGTVRIITNKPDLSGSYGAANFELNSVAHGGLGYTGEAFVNMPVSSNIAARAVAWYRHDAGYIDNVHGQLELTEYEQLGGPTGNTLILDNAEFADDDYNDIDTYGARAALRIDLNESWTITPQIIGQVQKANGSFAEESGLGKLKTMQFNDEWVKDKWMQAALTVEGKLGNFDATYAGSYMKRQVDSALDYSDYAYFYNELSGYGAYWYDNDGNAVTPNQLVLGDDSYGKQSHELRFTSPADNRLRLVAGLFYQRQKHNIHQDYIIPGIADDLVVPGTDGNIWFTKQIRVDRDYAVFGELSYDITPQITATGGGRLYRFDNSLVGFFGFSDNYSGTTGVAACFGPPKVSGSPCTNLDKRTKDSGFVHRLNLTYKPNADVLVYGTWSRGFRPGGINRRGTFPPYKPDFLTNYELGTKISFAPGAHFNVAGYVQDWNDMQVSVLGENGLTVVQNVGSARISGVEADLLLRPMAGLSWSTGVAYNRGRLREDFCFDQEDPECDDSDLDILAEKGDRLPLTATWKGSSRARYEWAVTPAVEANVQGSLSYEGSRRRDLRPGVDAIYGRLKPYTEVDLSAGVVKDQWTADLFVKNLFDVRGQLSKSIQCNEAVCGDPGGDTLIGGKIYTVVSRPRTIGLRVGRRF